MHLTRTEAGVIGRAGAGSLDLRMAVAGAGAVCMAGSRLQPVLLGLCGVGTGALNMTGAES